MLPPVPRRLYRRNWLIALLLTGVSLAVATPFLYRLLIRAYRRSMTAVQERHKLFQDIMALPSLEQESFIMNSPHTKLPSQRCQLTRLIAAMHRTKQELYQVNMHPLLQDMKYELRQLKSHILKLKSIPKPQAHTIDLEL